MARYATHLEKHGWRLSAAALVLPFLVCCNSGCQVPNFQTGNAELKPIEQIAQESVLAAKSQHGEFETITPTDSSEPSATNPIQASSPIGQYEPRQAGPYANVLIDEIFDQTDIRDALQAISTQANVSIIIDDQVAGSVTALIQNEPLEQALRKVLLPLGLHYRVVDNQYLVCSSDPSSPMFSKIADRLDYTPIFTAPKELVELLSEKNRQFVRIAAKRNMIIVEAPSEIARNIMHELYLFDRPVPQVVLEAMVVVVSPDSGFKFGVNLKHLYAEDNRAIGVALDGLELSGNFTADIAEEVFKKFSTTSFFIRALEQEGYLSIRATPHVMAKNGEKAEISIARETFFSTQPFFDANVFVRQEIQKVEAGISLIITPTIRGDNVDMVIEKAEVSEDIRASVNDPAVDNPFPLINRRQVSTTVHVKDGETVVIGGLMQNQVVDRVSQVPYLSNLPVVGPLFRQTIQEEQAAEVVVFISPRIVRQGTPHPMAGNVPTVQCGNEFDFQRCFPRDNGLEIGGYEQIAHQYPVAADGTYYGSTPPPNTPMGFMANNRNYIHPQPSSPMHTIPGQHAPGAYQNHVPATQQLRQHRAGQQPIPRHTFSRQRQILPQNISRQHIPQQQIHQQYGLQQQAPRPRYLATPPPGQEPMTQRQHPQQTAPGYHFSHAETKSMQPKSSETDPNSNAPSNTRWPLYHQTRIPAAQLFREDPFQDVANINNPDNVVRMIKDDAVRQAGYQQREMHSGQHVPARR